MMAVKVEYVKGPPDAWVVVTDVHEDCDTLDVDGKWLLVCADTDSCPRAVYATKNVIRAVVG